VSLRREIRYAAEELLSITNSEDGGVGMATSAEWHEDYEKMSEEALNFSRGQ
jgi:hypothetical protein